MTNNIHLPNRRRKKELSVGIFWVIGGKLVIDSTPLSNAEDYGAFEIHPGDHCSVWRSFSEAVLFLPTWSTRNVHAVE